ncbi:hypothetical protein BpHYR1_001806 [Brachionus plicatilis]|uniref:Uncharacterized protein n=1 Tax=Brachionus plicatilis TaxID=10195 RepID=A0A3M7S7U6_BRAPC|nr:hypothetical protein BpHYR1_001806 [Brachionus plicatilis]
MVMPKSLTNVSSRRPSCRFDHGRRLHVGQLFDASLTGHNVAHFQWQVRVLLLLTHLQTRQMSVLQTNAVLFAKVLCHSALDCLAGLELKWKCLSVSGPSCYIAHAILATHGATMCYLNFETFYFFGEFDALCIVQWLVVLLQI